MHSPIIIQAELRIPPAVVQSGDMEEIERLLQGYGLLPVTARERRYWRMDPEAPGGYILQYTFVLRDFLERPTP